MKKTVNWWLYLGIR